MFVEQDEKGQSVLVTLAQSSFSVVNKYKNLLQPAPKIEGERKTFIQQFSPHIHIFNCLSKSQADPKVLDLSKLP